MLPQTRFAAAARLRHGRSSGSVTAPAGLPRRRRRQRRQEAGQARPGPAAQPTAVRLGGDVHAATPPPPRRCVSRARPATAPTCGRSLSTPATPTPAPASRGSRDAARMRLLTADAPALAGRAGGRVLHRGSSACPCRWTKIEPGIAQPPRPCPSAPARRPPTVRHRHPHHRQHAKYGALEVEHAGGRGAPRLRRQGLRHDQPQHGDDALLRHLRRRRVGEATGRELLHDAVGASFNRITVDGQESTNDMVARPLQRRLRGDARARTGWRGSAEALRGRAALARRRRSSPTARARRRTMKLDGDRRRATRARPRPSPAPSPTRRSSRRPSTAATPTGAASCRPSARRSAATAARRLPARRSPTRTSSSCETRAAGGAGRGRAGPARRRSCTSPRST